MRNFTDALPQKWRPYAKSLVAGITGALPPLYVSLADSVVTGQEWVAIAAGFFGVGAAVYGTRNDTKIS